MIIVKRKKFNNPILILLLTTLVIATSCERINTDLPIIPTKNKTVMVYMAANNNLSQDAFTNIAQLELGHVPTDEEGNLIVYSHTEDANPKLIRLYKDDQGTVIKDTVYNFPETNSATTKALVSAMSVTKTMFPAEETGLVLWSHATGWLPEGYYSTDTNSSTQSIASQSSSANLWPSPPNGIDPYKHMVKSFGSEYNADDDSIYEIDIPDLAKSIPHKLDFIIFDACLMGGIETAYELKDSTDYIVFSPAEVLAEGLGYAGMMEPLFKSPTDVVGMAKNAYDFYSEKTGDYRSITISVIESAKLDKVAESAKKVFDLYRDTIPSLNTSLIQPYFRYNKYWFFDINDFITQMAGEQGKESAAEFTEALNSAVIYKATTGRLINLTIDQSKFSGVSTFIPYHPVDTELEEFYKNYKWEQEVQMLGNE